MENIPASQQVQQLTAQLNKALLDKVLADERVAALSDQIKALRNLLAGVGLGQQLQQQIGAEASAAQTE